MSVHRQQQPAYVLRGHSAPVHTLKFTAANTQLLTGDAEGWIVVWDLVSKRPSAVWRAHSEPILKIDIWGSRNVVTHGRDHKIFIWDLDVAQARSSSPNNERVLSTVFPLDNTQDRPKPLLAYELDVNALNFCAFSMLCLDTSAEEQVLLAVPNSLDSRVVDIIELPSKRRIRKQIGKSSVDMGICMALNLYETKNLLVLIVGYESGHVKTFTIDKKALQHEDVPWRNVYTAQCHSQPVLSLDISHKMDSFYTSSADALIVQHALLPASAAAAAANTLDSDGKISNPLHVINTRHSGQQSLVVRSDSRIFATAGWDAKARVYSTKSLKELAVLQWHKEGCYVVAFGNIIDLEQEASQTEESNTMMVDTIVDAEQRRAKATSSIHWLAIGSKDGKVSLWEMY